MDGDHWEPWRELRGRAHIVFALEALPDAIDAIYWPRSNRAAIVIDSRLGRRQRRAALAHELIHDERGGGADQPDMPDSWHAVVARDEQTVDREVAARLVPTGELRLLVDDLAELGHPVEVWEIAEAFDVPDDVARLALRMLADG